MAEEPKKPTEATLFNEALTRLGSIYRVKEGDFMARGLVAAFMAVAERLEKIEQRLNQ